MTRRHTLVAGVGYRDLADFSVGPLAYDALSDEPIPPFVELEDFSYNPVAVVHTLQDRRDRYGRFVIVGATRRRRPAGSVIAYRWDGVLPETDRIQERVAEAVTGVIDLDNLLIVLGQFGVLPDEVVVVEVEPETEAFGETMSAPGAAGFARAVEMVRELAVAPSVDHLPRRPLGGPPENR